MTIAIGMLASNEQSKGIPAVAAQIPGAMHSHCAQKQQRCSQFPPTKLGPAWLLLTEHRKAFGERFFGSKGSPIRLRGCSFLHRLLCSCVPETPLLERPFSRWAFGLLTHRVALRWTPNGCFQRG